MASHRCIKRQDQGTGYICVLKALCIVIQKGAFEGNSGGREQSPRLTSARGEKAEPV